MPAQPQIGQGYYQEIALKDKAMDRAPYISLTEKVVVPAGTFDHCLKTEETSAVENERECKLYSPNIGLLVDEGCKLTKYGFLKK